MSWAEQCVCPAGSEGAGLSLETQLQCQRLLAIPPGRALHPGIDSLNVSVAAGESTKPQLLHLTVQHPCPLNDFLVVWGKKIPYYLFIFAFLQVSSCTPSAARNGGMEIEILFFFWWKKLLGVDMEMLFPGSPPSL